MQSTSCETLGWMKHKLESRLLGEVSITSEMMAEIEEPPDESEKESEKAGLKSNIQKLKVMASGPITSWQIDGETVETGRFYILGFQNHCGW